MPRVFRPEERYRCMKCHQRIVYRAGLHCLLCRDPKRQGNAQLGLHKAPLERLKVRRFR